MTSAPIKVTKRPACRAIPLPSGAVYVRYACVRSMTSLLVADGLRFELRVEARRTLAVSPKLSSLTNPTPPSEVRSRCRLNWVRLKPLTSVSNARYWLMPGPKAVGLGPPLLTRLVLISATSFSIAPTCSPTVAGAGAAAVELAAAGAFTSAWLLITPISPLSSLTSCCSSCTSFCRSALEDGSPDPAHDTPPQPNVSAAPSSAKRGAVERQLLPTLMPLSLPGDRASRRLLFWVNSGRTRSPAAIAFNQVSALLVQSRGVPFNQCRKVCVCAKASTR